MSTNLLFELLQVALGRRERLSRVPSVREWEEVYENAWKQGVVGLLLSALERLPADFLPPLELKLQWIGDVQINEHQNKVMNQKCVALLGILEKAGLRGTILKGQGIARLYGDLASRRQAGDIDVYVDCGMEKALAFARSLGQKDISWDYKHLHLNLWEDTEVEVHYRVELLFDLVKNRKLLRWFKEHEEMLFEGKWMMDDGRGELMTPSVEMNVFYILLHIYRHFLHTGVGIRQVMDYYMVLRTVNNEKTKTKSAMAAVSEFGMERFARGLMWVLKGVMAMPQEWMLWEPDEREGQYILAQVMEGGNFGHYSEKRSRLTGGLGYVTRIVRHSLHMVQRYPSVALWTPVWVVWHKGWKIRKRWQLKRMHVLDSSNR